MEPNKLDVVNEEMKAEKNNTGNQILLVIVFFLILGCIIGACVGPILLINMGKLELAFGLPVILAGIAFLAGGILALSSKFKIGIVFVLIGIVMLVYGLSLAYPKEILDFFDFHNSFKYFADIFWGIVVLGIGIGLIVSNHISKKNSVLVHAVVKEYIEIKEGIIRPVVEFYYNNHTYQITCGTSQVRKGALVGDNVAICIDKDNPSQLSKYSKNDIVLWGFVAMFLIMGIYILLKTITNFF